jgi:hypothetical protein
MLAGPKARPFLFLSDGSLNVTNFCLIASLRVKQEPISQIKHDPDDSDPIRFRSETYDAPETRMGKFTKENSSSYAVDPWTYGAPLLGVKQEPQGVQDQAPVAGPSQALWDEWARYQSNLQQLDNPGRCQCLLGVPHARHYKTFTSSLSYSGESRALCPAICGTNPYHSITRNHWRII